MDGATWLAALVFLPAVGSPLLAHRSFGRFPFWSRVVLSGAAGAALVSFSMTLLALADRAWGVANSLVAMGVQPGEHVGVLMTNHPDLIASVFGASLIGAGCRRIPCRT